MSDVTGICAVGDNVVDRYLDRGEMYPGGNAVNVAVHARRLGMRAAYIGIVGSDIAGRLVASSLRSEGVLLERMRVVDGPNAWAAVQLVDGDRMFVGADKGVSRFELDADCLEYLEQFTLVHVGYAGGLEHQVPLIAERTAVSFDFADRSREFAEPVLPFVRFATFSAGDVGLDGVDELIDWAHALGAETVIVTAGSEGAVVSDPSGRSHVPATPITVVDTLGAGDAYIAAYLVHALNGSPRDVAMQAASDYAASICSQYGAYGYRSADSLPPIG